MMYEFKNISTQKYLRENLLITLIRIKLHSKVNTFYCTSFSPSKDMLNIFNTKMFDSDKSKTAYCH